MRWFGRFRYCAECRLVEHDFCLAKRGFQPCACWTCWGARKAGRSHVTEVTAVPRWLPQPRFAIFGYVVQGPVLGSDGEVSVREHEIVLASQRVEDTSFRRVVDGWTKGWRGARLLNEKFVVTCDVRDATILQGEFKEIMPELWQKLTGAT